MTTKKIIEMVGECPPNPLVYDGDKWAYYLDNIIEVQPPEDMDDGQKHWQAEIVEVVPLSEYYARERERIASEISLSEARGAVTAWNLILASQGAGGE